jgi:DNA invertase Pin-like site-specific DNA recombinase
MNVGIYARKSVYSDKSDSIETQIKICKEYAQSNYNPSTVSIYEDEGFTGANTHRPGYEKLVKDIAAKKIDILICYKIDRISRNVLDFSSTFNTLQEQGIQFVSVKEQIDTSTALGRAMMYICSVFAQMERETTAERVKDSMIELAKSGKWAGGKAPVGFKRERKVINGKSHTILVKNDEEVPYLNMIFDTFLKGYSLARLDTHFRKQGIRTINDKYFSATQIYNILKNPHYVAATEEVYDYFESLGCIMAVERESFNGSHGVIVYNRTQGGKRKKHTVNTSEKWIISVGLHEPLIPSEKWLAVQRCFGQNKIDKTRKYNIGLLKGILKCKCGYTMRVQHKVDKQYNKVYDNYFCQNRNKRGKENCDMSMINVNAIDDKLLEILKNITLDKSLIKKYSLPVETPMHIRNKESIKTEISNTEKKINNLTIALHENKESTAIKYVIAEIEKLDKKITGLRYELREVEMYEVEKKQRNDDIDTMYDKICKCMQGFENLDYKKQTSYVQDIIKTCVWDGNNLAITI